MRLRGEGASGGAAALGLSLNEHYEDGTEICRLRARVGSRPAAILQEAGSADAELPDGDREGGRVD